MMFWGKLIGGVLGFIIFGGGILSVIGACLGIWIGHKFDRSIGRVKRINRAFFETLFVCLGHIAKADGTVSKKELDVARSIMRHMQLDASKTLEAMRLFEEGKKIDVYIAVENLYQVCHSKMLLRMFMHFLIQAAYADSNTLAAPHKQVLLKMANILHFSEAELNQMLNMFTAQQQFQEFFNSGFNQGSQSYSYSKRSTTSTTSLTQAYAVLGVSSTASFKEAKTAYRRLMNQYHPDKLASKGLPKDMLKAATEKTQQIKEAYDVIKEACGK